MVYYSFISTLSMLLRHFSAKLMDIVLKMHTTIKSILMDIHDV